ncbi:lipid-A-disaccharide kinase [Aequorivita sublithincola DSM 14238]|uniref:Tetraacyldisaccharide 4'-kinase n=1 Tax=Aequorivita sublithincola (strain DSM 14238 / LMG 21431 / ACAM 643 / 9-3) TaxID=746697 RepID=I3YSK4_AEQSU|nr:tetraacyldisaccharide 4'-kinase [Aequorivita sublithincola]AFL79972.1 lipid-A-disaccharide kinase [Aequorivita sublithincola DSM 14238]
MNFLRKLLFPFSLLYGGITALRNVMYNKGWLKSKSYDLPVICVGNLSTGGTGKSPMIEFLVSFLKEDHKIAVLSRGYKRKTTGFLEVLANSSVEKVGDEPLQFKKKYPNITVAVCEERQTGIEKLKNMVDVILLDDAFQHRKVKASLNILLTSFDSLYCNDCMLPAGNLREPKFGAKRANIIVVTKCPENIDESKIEAIKQKLNPKPHQQIYFSKIGYSAEIMNAKEVKSLDYLMDKEFLLVTGIANPKPLVSFLKKKGLKFEEKSFPDHHNFTTSEIEKLKNHQLILTTEKDFMRLQSITNSVEIYYLPIRTEILKDGEEDFKNRILRGVKLKD